MEITTTVIAPTLSLTIFSSKNPIIASYKIQIPDTASNKATKKPAKLSAFQWPYGCFSSTGFLAVFSPKKVIKEEKTSKPECTPSAIRATLPVKKPKASLDIPKPRFTKVLTIETD